MKTVFKIGMKVYDQVFEPDIKGEVIDVNMELSHPITVLFGHNTRYYTAEGCRGQHKIKTLSTSPYKIEGFEQKKPSPTYKEAVKWCIKNLKDYRESVCTEYVNEKQENAIEALRKLIILRDYYNEGWQPDWEDDEWKYFIEYYRGKLSVERTCGNNRVLAFKSKEIRDKFLEEQKELLEIAKPLL